MGIIGSLLKSAIQAGASAIPVVGPVLGPAVGAALQGPSGGSFLSRVGGAGANIGISKGIGGLMGGTENPLNTVGDADLPIPSGSAFGQVTDTSFSLGAIPKDDLLSRQALRDILNSRGGI